MALMTTGSFPRALKEGVRQWVGLGYDERPEEFREIFEVVNSNDAFEIEVTHGPTGLLTLKPEGQAIDYQDMIQGFKKIYEHKVYATGLMITREAIEDNKYMALAEQRAKQLGRSARETKEIVCANVLNRAFNSAYPIADGLELCSAVHLLEKGGTYANELAAAADLSEASLEQAVIEMGAMVDGAGKQIAVRPRKLIIPKELEFSAKRILLSDMQAHTANNAINAVKGMFSEGVHVNHYLTDTDAFFILTSERDGGLKVLQRRALEVDDDMVFDTHSKKFQINERYSVGATDGRCIFGSPGV